MGKTAPVAGRLLVTDSAADHDVPAAKHVGPRQDLKAGSGGIDGSNAA
jgi:hypothetical protein